MFCRNIIWFRISIPKITNHNKGSVRIYMSISTHQVSYITQRIIYYQIYDLIIYIKVNIFIIYIYLIIYLYFIIYFENNHSKQRIKWKLINAFICTIHTEKTRFTFIFKLNGIWSWWEFSFQIWIPFGPKSIGKLSPRSYPIVNHVNWWQINLMQINKFTSSFLTLYLIN